MSSPVAVPTDAHPRPLDRTPPLLMNSCAWRRRRRTTVRLESGSAIPLGHSTSVADDSATRASSATGARSTRVVNPEYSLGNTGPSRVQWVNGCNGGHTSVDIDDAETLQDCWRNPSALGPEAPPLRHLSKSRPRGPKKRLPSRRHASIGAVGVGVAKVDHASARGHPGLGQPTQAQEATARLPNSEAVNSTTNNAFRLSTEEASTSTDNTDGQEGRPTPLRHLTKARPRRPHTRRPTRQNYSAKIAPGITSPDQSESAPGLVRPAVSAMLSFADGSVDIIRMMDTTNGSSSTDDIGTPDTCADTSHSPTIGDVDGAAGKGPREKNAWGVSLGGTSIAGSSSTDHSRVHKRVPATATKSVEQGIADRPQASIDVVVRRRPKKGSGSLGESQTLQARDKATHTDDDRHFVAKIRPLQAAAVEEVEVEGSDDTAALPLQHSIGHTVIGRHAKPAPFSRDSILDDAFDFSMFDVAPSPEAIAENEFQEIYESDEQVLHDRRDSMLELWAELGETSPT